MCDIDMFEFSTPLGDFYNMFTGRINRSSLNGNKEVYLINDKEYDISFLDYKKQEELFKLSVKEKKKLFLEACKDHEIVRTEEMKKKEKFAY